MYTSPVDRGYTSRWHPLRSSAQNSAAGSSATAFEASYTSDTDLTPVIGTCTSGNHSEARVDHGPMATTTTSASNDAVVPVVSSRTVTAATRVPPPLESDSVVVTFTTSPKTVRDPGSFIASSWSLVVSSSGVTCAVASSIKRADATSPSSHDTGGSAAIRRPPATDNVGIFR